MDSQWNQNALFNGPHGGNNRASRATAQEDEEDEHYIATDDAMDYMPADIFPIDRFSQPVSAASAGASNDKTVTHKSTHKSIVSSQNPYEDEAANNYSHANGNGFLDNSHMLNPDDLLSEATGYDAAQAADIDADAALALKLQQEEYAKESMASFRRQRVPFLMPYEHDEDDDRNPSQSVSLSTRNDELLARQLYRDEQRQRARFRPPRAYVPRPVEPQSDFRRQAAASQRSDDDRPEIIDMPSFFRVPPHALVRCRGDDDDDDSDDGGIILHEGHPMFPMMAHPARAGPMGAYHMFGPFRSRYRRGGNLQDTEDDFGPEDYERLLQLDDTIKKKKLDKKQINSIKTETFTLPPNNTDEENQCSICLERFKVNESLRRYPCSHLFHQGCSDRWLQENNVCPICRKPPVDVTTRSNSQSRRPPPHHDRSNPHRTSQNRNGHGRPPAPNSRSSRNSHQS